MSSEQHEALKKFSYQISYAVNHYTSHGLKASDFQNIVIGGLGGSGIGGRIVKSWYSNSCPVPIECIADYHLPAYVNEKTLVILGSYSGNTEETLQLFEETISRKCKVVIISAGGKLVDLATTHQLQVYQIEKGYQPRMALGFSLTYLMLVFAELIGEDITNSLTDTARELENTAPFEEEASHLFESIKPKLKYKLVVLTDGLLEPVGVRFAQQIQENAKHECFSHTLPEMNHNVIESYYGQLESIFFLLDSKQNERVSSRFEFMNNLLEVEYNKVINMPIEDCTLNSLYQTIHVLDWLSLYIADHRKVDSLNVPNISSLKEFLDQA